MIPASRKHSKPQIRVWHAKFENGSNSLSTTTRRHTIPSTAARQQAGLLSPGATKFRLGCKATASLNSYGQYLRVASFRNAFETLKRRWSLAAPIYCTKKLFA